MVGSNWGERAAALSPRLSLARIFMRGSAPRTPHRFNGYTSPTWIPWLIRARMQYQNKVGRSTCENAVFKKMGDQRARMHVSDNLEAIEAIEAIEVIETIETIVAIVHSRMLLLFPHFL